jgi:hypothetical protein
MSNKSKFIGMLRDEFERWEKILSGLSEDQSNIPMSPSTFSVKDTLAHLRAWQQISIARLEAALSDVNPRYPEWLAGLDPFEAESDEYRDNCNDTIFHVYHEQPWSKVHQVWKEGYLRFLDLAEQIPENGYSDAKKYMWLREYPLLTVLEGSYEHHHFEHLEPLFDWLGKHGG